MDSHIHLYSIIRQAHQINRGACDQTVGLNTHVQVSECVCVELSTLAHMTATDMRQKVQRSGPQNSLPSPPILKKQQAARDFVFLCLI